MTSQSWIGRSIGNRYQLETLLGAGGMSAVYRGYDPNLRRVVAVKLIHPHLSINPHFIDRFKEEAAAVASLRHPNIVQVHDFNNEGEVYYMVMEYLAGETLQARLRRINTAGRHLALAEALRISLQICDAADYAHRHDLVHRDIKPANIMLDVHGQAILMDFGIVKIVGGQYHTATGATIGTAIYMSPEQIRGERVDERSDIYSMGVMLFEMLSGRPPYEADSALTLMMMHLNDPIPNPSDLRRDVPTELAAVVIRSLAKDREERYQTAAEMAKDLNKVEPVLVPISAPAPTIAATAPFSPGTAPSAARVTPTQLDNDLTQPAPEPTGAPQLIEEAGLPLDSSHRPDEAAPAMFSSAAEPVDIEHPLPASHGPVPTQDSPVIEPSETKVPTAQAAQDATAIESSPTAELPASVSSADLGVRRWPRWLLPLLGIALLAVLAVAIIWFIPQRRPPTLQLMPIERPPIPINLESQSRLVSLGQWEVNASCQQLAFSPDLNTLAFACNREEMRFSPYRYYASLYQVEPGVLQAHLQDHTAWMKSVDFSPDGAWLATSAEDKRINLWQVSDGALLRTIDSDDGAISSLAFSPNGKLLAGAGWHGAGLWQVSNGVLLRTYSSDDNPLGSVAFSPDGEYLAGGSDAGLVYLWRVSDGALLTTLPGHSAQVGQLAFSAYGAQLASASSDKTINLWRVPEGELLATLTDHQDGVTGIAFSPDGSLLASSSWDGTLRLWRASDGLPVRGIQNDESLHALVFSPDGAWLITASGDGRLNFWGVSEAVSLLPASQGK